MIMKKRFKKIYVEITNRCNLTCSFCGVNRRKLRDMSCEEFAEVLKKIKPYTDYIYLHVKGEPLLHCKLDDILFICDSFSMKVNITTNATLIKERKNILLSHPCIRQINISLHCENDYPSYFSDVFDTCKILSTKMFISYRIWNLKNGSLDEKSTSIVKKIINYYDLSSDIVDKLYESQSVKIDINTFVNKDNLFIWPSLENNFVVDGFCYGLKTHIGILSNGDVVPCCLDSNGEIKLGNIFSDSLEDIISGKKYKDLEKGFMDNKCLHPLCKGCNFKNRFNKS